MSYFRGSRQLPLIKEGHNNSHMFRALKCFFAVSAIILIVDRYEGAKKSSYIYILNLRNNK